MKPYGLNILFKNGVLNVHILVIELTIKYQNFTVVSKMFLHSHPNLSSFENKLRQFNFFTLLWFLFVFPVDQSTVPPRSILGFQWTSFWYNWVVSNTSGFAFSKIDILCILNDATRWISAFPSRHVPYLCIKRFARGHFWNIYKCTHFIVQVSIFLFGSQKHFPQYIYVLQFLSYFWS